MKTELSYPLIPKSTSSLIPGQFWALPLSDGSFGCGRVIQLLPKSATGARVLFLAAVMDWRSTSPPNETSIADASCLDQGIVHYKSISLTGGAILGMRDLALDRISPWYFRGAQFHVNSRVHHGLNPVRPQTAQDRYLPVLSTWGLGFAQIIAEKHLKKD